MLVRGQQSRERVALLIGLTSIRSEATIEALNDVLYMGHTECAAAVLNGISQSNLVRAITKLNEVARVVESIKELDWAAFRSNK